MGKNPAMVKPSKPEEGYALMKRKIGVLKGYLSQKAVEEWPEDPMSACLANGLFLEHWFQLEHTKPQTRACIQEAFPGLQPGKAKKLLDGIGEARNFLKKKWSNMKTGDKTPPALISLMQRLFGEQSSSEVVRPMGGGPSNSSAKDARERTSQGRQASEPEKADPVEEEREKECKEPVKAKAKGGLLIALPLDNASVVSVSSTEAISKDK